MPHSICKKKRKKDIVSVKQNKVYHNENFTDTLISISVCLVCVMRRDNDDEDDNNDDVI